jgi:small subunit ribosomal protein S19e
VGGFQKIYGGRQRNGSCPPHFCKSSGAISRNILQQFQKMGIIDIDPKGYLKSLCLSLLLGYFPWLWRCAYCAFLLLPCSGRLITSQGRRDLDQVAGRVAVEA